MKEYNQVPTTYQELAAVICDVCGERHDDPLEIQEFVSIRFTGGYGSAFGDGDTYECDICQRCLKRLLGSYLRLINSAYGTYVQMPDPALGSDLGTPTVNNQYRWASAEAGSYGSYGG